RVEDTKGNTKTIYVKGERQTWEFNQDVYESLTSLEAIPDNPLLKVLAFPGSVLRASVTNFPVFAARNIVRDTQSRILLTRNNSGLKELIHSKRDKDLFELYGGSQAGFHLLDKNFHAEALGGAIRSIAKEKTGLVLDPRRIWKGYSNFL